ncbi:DUF3592 domain-containing protein [Streptomyces roseoverticillatus]|uniref:DUF3592 domain-containing protein n=1 Tax=Streptomyces roseoverticillatus TaxID=66429 RepID=UPI001F2FAEF2|nr:DUF3592 domain-containing protein [Streptomyces roseoverticillatus]MCF3105650.1 DUF3592 domain-containing protein [Streptomyces roseoverticillatus]
MPARTEGLLPLCVAALFGVFSVHYLRRLFTVLRVLRHGERATGHCVDIRWRRSTDSDGDTKCYVFAFQDRDGHEVRFEDHARAFRGFTVGSPVRVSYDPGAPLKTATIADRENWGAVAVPALLGTAFGLVTLVLVVVAGLVAGIL